MNFKTISSVIGKVIFFEAVLMLLPLIVAVIYKEDWTPFAITIGVSLVVGFFLDKFFSHDYNTISIRDGYAIVSFSWIAVSIIAAVPFVISGSIPSFIDAFFETVSGFTTTGASILRDVEAMPHGMLFWRSLTHWIGGMGILVFITAIAAKAPGRTINILKAEMPGHSVDKLVPKTKRTAVFLYQMYVLLTALEIVFLLAGGMPLFDSLVHAFGTAGTGGFGIKADSIASYSPYLQWVITIFMFIFMMNFNFYYLLIKRKFRPVLNSNELRWAIFIALGAIAIIAFNISGMYSTFEEALRYAAFQVSSIMSTTGYATADFNLWPQLSKTVLFLLMFVGGCMGSTAGGLKVSRIVVLAQVIKNHFIQVLSPRTVRTVKLNGKLMDDAMISKTTGYFAIYMFTLALSFFLISFDHMDFETNMTAAVACINNIGPGFAQVGPAFNYADYSDFSKLVLSVTMLLGRLEIYPLVLSIMPVNKIR